MSKNIVLLGHGAGIKFTVESLRNNPSLGYTVSGIVTHPFKDHQHDLEMIKKRADVYGDYAYNVFDAEKDYNIPVFESEDVNSDATVSWIESKNPAYIISIGCRNIIRKAFLNTFKQRVLNIHTTPLPKYRGAASDTWMILNGEWCTKQYGCIHFIDEGIDTGNIVAKSYYEIPPYSYPIDVFKQRMGTYKELLVEALSALKEDNYSGEPQKMEDATVFPRLYTPVDGKINWSMKGEDLIRFIFGFGYPHEGASCFLGEQKINILKAEYRSDIILHPYAAGLIFGKDGEGNYKVSVPDGYLILKVVEVNGVVVEQKKILKLGRRLI